MYQPRPYQLKAVEAGLNALNTHGNGVLVMATGTGKTETMCWVYQRRRQQLLAQGLNPRCLLLSHRDELVRQPIDKWMKNVFSIGELTMGGVKADAMKDYHAEVISASVQTLSRSPEKLDKILAYGPITDLYTDEAHHSTSASYRQVYEYLRERCPGMVELGVTATPHRHDKDNIAAVYPSISEKFTFTYSIEDGINDGYLSPLKPRLIKGVVDISAVKFNAAGEANAKQMLDLFETGNWPDLIYEAWRDHAADLPTIAFLPSVEIVKAFTLVMGQQFDIPIAYVSSQGCEIWSSGRRQLIEEKRATVIEMYRKGHITMLCNCGILTEGFDAPVRCIIMARPTKSVGEHTQMVGRGTRIEPGKTHCELLYMNFQGHPLPSYKHATGSMNLAEIEKLKDKLARVSGQGRAATGLCPNCQKGDLLPQANLSFLCSKCGYIWMPSKEQMRMFDPDELAASLYDPLSPKGVTYYAIALNLFEDSSAAWFTRPDKQQWSLSLGATTHRDVLVERALFMIPPDQAKNEEGQYELLALYRRSRPYWLESEAGPVCSKCRSTADTTDQKCPHCGHTAWEPWQLKQVYQSKDVKQLHEIAQEKWREYGDETLSAKNKKWRKEPPSPGQVKLLNQFKMFTPFLRKGEASQIISHELLRKACKTIGYHRV